MNASARARNRIASALLISATAAAVGLTWFLAPARQVDHSVASEAISQAENPALPSASVPESAAFLWSEQQSDVALPQPLVVNQSVILPQSHGIRALDATTGKEKWHYQRNRTLCAVTTSRELVVATFDGPSGCTETVSLYPDTGQYRATRRSSNITDAHPIRSNSYSGVFSGTYLELWRDDLVRVVEYGQVSAAQEPNLQPHPGCSIISAATRVDLLAVINDCQGEKRLVIQNANPEESRTPEVYSDTVLRDYGTDNSAAKASDSTAFFPQIVAIGQSSVAVSSGNTIQSFNKSGQRQASVDISEEAKKVSGLEGDAPAPVAGSSNSSPSISPSTADLPHHMTWYSPRGLVGFEPSALRFSFVFPEAVGTGVARGGRLLFPTEKGIAVANWDTGEIGREIPLPRPQPYNPAEHKDPAPPVTLAMVGDTLLESHAGQLTAYSLA